MTKIAQYVLHSKESLDAHGGGMVEHHMQGKSLSLDLSQVTNHLNEAFDIIEVAKDDHIEFGAIASQPIAYSLRVSDVAMIFPVAKDGVTAKLVKRIELFLQKTFQVDPENIHQEALFISEAELRKLLQENTDNLYQIQIDGQNQIAGALDFSKLIQSKTLGLAPLEGYVHISAGDLKPSDQPVGFMAYLYLPKLKKIYPLLISTEPVTERAVQKIERHQIEFLLVPEAYILSFLAKRDSEA